MQPVLLSEQYATAMETPLDIATDEATQRALKIYVPLPYGADWQAENPVQETYSDSTGIYNIVASRYENDTLYLTLMPNLNAHSQFDALSSVINELSDRDDKTDGSTQQKEGLSLNDLLKVFPPPTPPALVRSDFDDYFQSHTSMWEYTFFVPTNNNTTFSPPPEV